MGSPEVDAALQRRMLEVTDAITRRGATAVWLTLPSIDAVPGVDRGPAGDPARSARYRELITQLPALRPGDPVAVVDLAGWLAGAADPSLRPDGVHLTQAAAASVVERWLGPAVLDAYRRTASGKASPSSSVPGTLVPVPTPPRTPGTVGGWARYWGDDALHGGTPSAEAQGWIRSGDLAGRPGRAPVYDQPDGQIVGFAYSQLGFVPLAADATFDAHAERVRRFGCDGFADPTCEPSLGPTEGG